MSLKQLTLCTFLQAQHPPTLRLVGTFTPSSLTSIRTPIPIITSGKATIHSLAWDVMVVGMLFFFTYVHVSLDLQHTYLTVLLY